LLISSSVPVVFLYSRGAEAEHSEFYCCMYFIFLLPKSAVLLVVVTHTVDGRQVDYLKQNQAHSILSFLRGSYSCGWCCAVPAEGGSVVPSSNPPLPQQRFWLPRAGVPSSRSLPAEDLGSRWLQANLTRPDSGEVHTAVSVHNFLKS